ncbi:MAG TPA: flagellar export chaperone FliS [Clostridia bacterium]|nr:flagellar export chaperone FliS [Clostridia bacterium]
MTDSKESTQSRAFSSNGVSSSSAYKQYQQNSVNTASPQELTFMLYNGLIRFLKLAHEGITEKNIEKANNNIIRSQDIIMEFAATLDMQYEVSNGLMALYDYMNRRLIEANLHKDNAIVEEIIGLAEELRDTWAQAMKLAKQQTAASL